MLQPPKDLAHRVHAALSGGRWRGVAFVWVAVLSLGLVFDRVVYRAFDDVASKRGDDWYEAMRVLGFLPVWAMISLSVSLHAPNAIKRGVAVFIAPMAAGLAAEVIKVIVGRERPRNTGGSYVFRTIMERFESPSLGFPSSHVAVAAGGAFMLSMLWPRTWPVCLMLIVACTWSRVADGGAHFMSDAAGAAAIGYLAARITHKLLLAPREAHLTSSTTHTA